MVCLVDLISDPCYCFVCKHLRHFPVRRMRASGYFLSIFTGRIHSLSSGAMRAIPLEYPSTMQQVLDLSFAGNDVLAWARAALWILGAVALMKFLLPVVIRRISRWAVGTTTHLDDAVVKALGAARGIADLDERCGAGRCRGGRHPGGAGHAADDQHCDAGMAQPWRDS